MTEQIERAPATFMLAPQDCARLARALSRDFEAFLAPGERFAVQGEVGEGFVYAQLVLSRPDRSFQLDLEAVAVEQDHSDGEVPTGKEGIALLLEFLRLQLYEFFRQDRHQRFHIDWRGYLYEGASLRFRGSLRSPQLEEQADALLEEEPRP